MYIFLEGFMTFARKTILMALAVCALSLLMTSCFNEKESLLYDSEWLLENIDEKGQAYCHQLFLKPNHEVTIQAYYANSTTAIVWTGKYKLNSKKIIFKFENCYRFENGENVGSYKAGRVINYFSGEFFYSTGLVGDDEKEYHLQLIRPKNYFYGKNLDFFGNPMEEFVRVSE